ncbi:hypothetical protein KOAAANKH_01398 [Brevundimonas sp. NIBR10]|nr:hypothetical protein KOAAANKH_01398 [Brevundimonas sp. NIBR10]
MSVPQSPFRSTQTRLPVPDWTISNLSDAERRIAFLSAQGVQEIVSQSVTMQRA